MAKQSKGVALLLGIGKPQGEDSEDDDQPIDAGRESAASLILDAIKADDPAMLADALSDFLSM
jgi:hypothetical protein